MVVGSKPMVDTKTEFKYSSLYLHMENLIVNVSVKGCGQDDLNCLIESKS